MLEKTNKNVAYKSAIYMWLSYLFSSKMGFIHDKKSLYNVIHDQKVILHIIYY